MNFRVKIEPGLLPALMIPRIVAMRLVAAILNDIPDRFRRPGYANNAEVKGQPGRYRSTIAISEGGKNYAFRLILIDRGNDLLACVSIQLFGVWDAKG